MRIKIVCTCLRNILKRTNKGCNAWISMASRSSRSFLVLCELNLGFHNFQICPVFILFVVTLNGSRWFTWYSCIKSKLSCCDVGFNHRSTGVWQIPLKLLLGRYLMNQFCYVLTNLWYVGTRK